MGRRYFNHERKEGRNNKIKRVKSNLVLILILFLAFSTVNLVNEIKSQAHSEKIAGIHDYRYDRLVRNGSPAKSG